MYLFLKFRDQFADDFFHKIITSFSVRFFKICLQKHQKRHPKILPNCAFSWNSEFNLPKIFFLKFSPYFRFVFLKFVFKILPNCAFSWNSEINLPIIFFRKILTSFSVRKTSKKTPPNSSKICRKFSYQFADDFFHKILTSF